MHAKQGSVAWAGKDAGGQAVAPLGMGAIELEYRSDFRLLVLCHVCIHDSTGLPPGFQSFCIHHASAAQAHGIASTTDISALHSFVDLAMLFGSISHVCCSTQPRGFGQERSQSSFVLYAVMTCCTAKAKAYQSLHACKALST